MPAGDTAKTALTVGWRVRQSRHYLSLYSADREPAVVEPRPRRRRDLGGFLRNACGKQAKSAIGRLQGAQLSVEHLGDDEGFVRLISPAAITAFVCFLGSVAENRRSAHATNGSRSTNAFRLPSNGRRSRHPGLRLFPRGNDKEAEALGPGLPVRKSNSGRHRSHNRRWRNPVTRNEASFPAVL
jgi:hypothetical protein